MKVKNGDKVEEITAVWYEKPIIKMIDQRILPKEFKVIDIYNPEELHSAIKTMVVRGAPSIGAAAALGIAQASDIGYDMEKAATLIKSAKRGRISLYGLTKQGLGSKELDLQPGSYYRRI